jgi:sulfur-oxidizing protein SoxB
MVRIGGMDYACAPAAGIGQRISDMVLDSGKPLEAATIYRVAGWASVNPQEGKPVAEIFAGYLRAQKTARPRKLNRVLIKGMPDNPGIAG